MHSIQYVQKVTSRLPKGALRLSTPVHSITNSIVNGKPKVTVRTISGHVEEYDHVIMATHSGASLRMLENGGQATPEERAILGGFQWTMNPTVLHSDVTVSHFSSIDCSLVGCGTDGGGLMRRHCRLGNARGALGIM